MTSSARTLIPVLQFWTFALPRVPRTLITATSAMRRSAKAFAPQGGSETN
jgi:hypothetical protein